MSCSRVLICSVFLHYFTNPFVNVITVPPKFGGRKQKISKKPVIYNDVDDDLYVMQSYGKAMTRSSRWLTRPQSDLLLWDSLFFSAELMNDFRIELSIDTNIRKSFLSIIKDNWVSF